MSDVASSTKTRKSFCRTTLLSSRTGGRNNHTTRPSADSSPRPGADQGCLQVVCTDGSCGTENASPVSQKSNNDSSDTVEPNSSANGARGTTPTGRSGSSPVPRALVARSIPAAIEALRPTVSSPSATYPHVDGCKTEAMSTRPDTAMLKHVFVDQDEKQRPEEQNDTKQSNSRPAREGENRYSDGYPCLLSSDAISGALRSTTTINSLDLSEFPREDSSQNFTHSSGASAEKYGFQADTLHKNPLRLSHLVAPVNRSVIVQMKVVKNSNDMPVLQTDSCDTIPMLGNKEDFMEETIGDARVTSDVARESPLEALDPPQVRTHTTSVATQWSPRSESDVQQQMQYDMSVGNLMAIIEAYSLRDKILTKDVEDGKKLLEHERAIFEEQIMRLRTDLDQRNDTLLKWQAECRLLQHEKQKSPILNTKP